MAPPNHSRGIRVNRMSLNQYRCVVPTIQGVDLSKETIIFNGPLILIMPILWLHVALGKLKDEATSKLYIGVNIKVIFLSFILLWDKQS